MANAAVVEEKTLNHQVQLLSDAIETKADFEAAVTRLSLLLTKKIGLRSSDVHRVVTNLREMDTAVVNKFTEKHGGKSVSVAVAQRQADNFRTECIERVLAGEIL